MKKLVWITSALLLTFSTAFSQDDTYYNGPAENAYSYDNSSQGNNNGYYNQQPYDYQYNDQPSAYQDFYDQLSPYGNWINYPGYGNVWVPAQVSADFAPYRTSGHWIYSDYGWTWVSDYEWGWAPFHYGRWFHDNYYGWMWMPGSEWAPAWVTWGSYSGYYCWAPLAPYASVSAYYRPDYYYWNFVPCQHICQYNLGGYIVNNNVCFRNNYYDVCSHITVVGNAGYCDNHHYYAGPRVQDVEHFVGHGVTHVNITASNRPVRTTVSGNQMTIYRPQLSHITMQNNGGMARQQVTPNRAAGMPGNGFSRQEGSLQSAHIQPMQNFNHAEQYTNRPENIMQEQHMFNNRTQSQTPVQPFENNMRSGALMQNQFNRSDVQSPRQVPSFQAPERGNVQMQQHSFNEISRPSQQQFMQPQRQEPVRQSAPSFQQHNFSQPERSFASVQRSQPSFQSARPSFQAQAFRGGGRR